MASDTPSSDAERAAQYEAILASAVDAIITINERGIVQNANPATTTLFGYTESELQGKNIRVLMPTPYNEEHDGYLENYRRTGQRKIIGVGREVVGKRKDGSTFPMHLAVSEVKTGSKRLFTGIVRDISDMKVIQEELSRLNTELEVLVQQRTEELRSAQAELIRKGKLALLGQVSGGIAHEIRNPLNAVKSSAYYLLHARNPSDEKKQEHLERIDRQVAVIDNVITALSDVARLPEPRVNPTCIVGLLESVISTVELPANIEVVWNLAESLPNVMVDENQIPIVFRNLFRNARDAMPEGGKLTITGESESGKVWIRVFDTGIGISEENLKRITEPLFSTKARGMGLGLAITKAIIEKNNGNLEIASQLGKGSEFTVCLPTEDSFDGATQ